MSPTQDQESVTPGAGVPGSLGFRAYEKNLTESSDYRDFSHRLGDELPDMLIDVLRRADDVPLSVPPKVDGTILRDAQRYLETIPWKIHHHRVWRALATFSSVYALPLVTVVMRTGDVPLQEFAQNSTVSASSHEIIAKDVDHNGTVSILDAYVMPRRLQAGNADHNWDFNDNGALNGDDIRLVAMDAVML